MVQRRWPIPYDPSAPRVENASPSLKMATAAALLAAKLKGDTLGDAVDLKTLGDLVSSLPASERDTGSNRQLNDMIQQARQISQQR